MLYELSDEHVSVIEDALEKLEGQGLPNDRIEAVRDALDPDLDYRHWANGRVWQGRHNAEQKLRIIEDRGEEVLVERFGLILPGEGRHPMIMAKLNVDTVFDVTDQYRGPVT